MTRSPASPHSQALALPGGPRPIRSLDGLRMLAITAVVLIHVQVIRGGWLGVSVFFVLSGFLITTLLLVERGDRGRIDFRAFYVRRLARLYPAIIVSVVVTGAVALLVERARPADVAFPGGAALLYIANWIPFVTNQWLPTFNFAWSLAQEEQFYLLAPAVIALVPSRHFRAAGVIALTAAAVLEATRFAALAAAPGSWISVYHNPLFNLDGLLAGSGVAFLFQVARRTERTRRFTLFSTWAAFLALGGIALVCVGISPSTPKMALATSAVVFATVVVLGNLVTRPTGALSRVLGCRPAVWVGQRSYGIYVYQLAVIAVGAVLLDQQPAWVRLLGACAEVVLILVMADLSLRFIESPIRRRVRTWIGSADPTRRRQEPSGRGSKGPDGAPADRPRVGVVE